MKIWHTLYEKFLILKQKFVEETEPVTTYHSTRNAGNTLTASQAILRGIAPDGGLYVPDHIPALDVALDQLSNLTYQETAYAVMKNFFDDFTEEELKQCIMSAYDEKFDDATIAPLVKVDGHYYLELFHGPTIAFKDMALSILPHLLTTSAKKNGSTKEIVILTATSGDTGKAALVGFADVPNTKIIVFYPKNGVSAIQEKQMVTQQGDNTFVIAIDGNFDDAQTNVKNMFGNAELSANLDAAGYQFSSANSINIGRLIPQVAYYVYAYGQMVKQGAIAAGEPMNVVVPTGNFGNILAAYFAKQMGLPIQKLVIASNENKVLVDFFQTGAYDRNRDFILTTSPSMDILVSSNLERLLYLMTDENPQAIQTFMDQLKEVGRYEVTEAMKEKAKDFYADYASEAEVSAQISGLYHTDGYVIDPHTAVAAHVANSYVAETKDSTPIVIASTASPYKFPQAVLDAIDPEFGEGTMEDMLERLKELSGVAYPKAIEELLNAEVRHDTVIASDDMQDSVEAILGLKH